MDESQCPSYSPRSMRSRANGLAVALLVASAALPAGAQDVVDEIVERERIRAHVSSQLRQYLDDTLGGGNRINLANDLLDNLEAEARDVAPYVIEELERDLLATFDVCALALGRMEVPEVADALRRAVARADEEVGAPARARKAMAAWGLGIHGEADAIDLLEQGRHRVADTPVHEKTTLIEAIAFQLGPASVPKLLELVEVYAADPERESWVVYALGGLRRVGDASSVPGLTALLSHEDGVVRREAARALGAISTDASVAALADAVRHPHLAVRRTAATSLRRIAPPEIADRVVEQLETEEDVLTRASLYRYLARALGPKAVPLLSRHIGSDDPADRRELVEAFATIPGPKPLDALRQALDDPDAGVSLPAGGALARMGTGPAVDALVAALEKAEGAQQTQLTQLLGELRDPRAGDHAAALAFSRLENARSPVDRLRAGRAVDLLVNLRHVESAPRLREFAEGNGDRGLRNKLESAARRLEAFDKVKTPDGWKALVADADPLMRRLAYERLGDDGSAAAATVLVEAFDAAEQQDRLFVLNALGDAGSAAAEPLLSRLLLEPEFDNENQLRDMAAWVATRVGGRSMSELLARAVERRQGRDSLVLFYAALAGGKQALPLVQRYRLDHMRYVGWERGQAQERLDRLAIELEQGISLWEDELPPYRLSLVP